MTQTASRLSHEPSAPHGNWQTLPPSFAVAIKQALTCVGRDEADFASTCIHIHPAFVEACDNYEAIRVAISTGMSECLVEGKSIKRILSCHMTEFCEAAEWLHFRDCDGLTLSCRRSFDEYEPLHEYLESSGDELSLPSDVVRACTTAKLFSRKASHENEVTVELRSGSLAVGREGTTGSLRVDLDASSYNGRDRVFTIQPKVLKRVANDFGRAHLSENRLTARAKNVAYAAAIGTVESPAR